MRSLILNFFFMIFGDGFIGGLINAKDCGNKPGNDLTFLNPFVPASQGYPFLLSLLINWSLLKINVSTLVKIGVVAASDPY